MKGTFILNLSFKLPTFLVSILRIFSSGIQYIFVTRFVKSKPPGRKMVQKNFDLRMNEQMNATQY